MPRPPLLASSVERKIERLLVGARGEDLHQFHQHGGAARIGQRVHLDDGRRVRGAR